MNSQFSRSNRASATGNGAGEFSHPDDEVIVANPLQGLRPMDVSIGQRESASVQTARLAKLGESLSSKYDLSGVRDVDRANIEYWIKTTVTLTESCPELDFKIIATNPQMYSLVFKGFDENLRGSVLEERFKGPNVRGHGLQDYVFNPHTCAMILEVQKLGDEPLDVRRPGQTKRGRVE